MKFFILALAVSPALACYSGPCLEFIGDFTNYSNGTKGSIELKVIANGTTVCDSARGWSENRGQFQPQCDEGFSYATDGYTSWYLINDTDDYIFNNKPPQNSGYECSAKIWCTGVSWDVKTNCLEPR
ncbi:hypothetical protein N431DRAFT_447310 [Stipitochalara longipes BDJ]|nr:hypothetical protein N431DRAFT_447310 [Stipitochalara longipes BDJ]